MGSRLRLVLAVLTACLLAACATPAPPPPPPSARPLAVQEIAVLINLGQERLGQGRFLEAGDAFRAALKRGPVGEQGVQARLGLGKAEAGAGRWAEALAPLRDMLAVGARPPVELEARLLASQAEQKLGQHAAAAARLRGLLARPPQPLSPEQRRQALDMLVQSLIPLGQHGPAASGLIHLANDSPPAQAELLSVRLYEQGLMVPLGELASLKAEAVSPAARATMDLVQARLLAKAGKTEESRALLEQAMAAPALPAELRRQAQAVGQDLAQAAMVSPQAVGVILPLSGNYAAHGRQMLAAVELGLALSTAGREGPTLFIEDDQGDPQTAAAAVTRLVEERKVVAIIGPMVTGAAVAAARQAQMLGVPIITLSQAEGVTRTGEYVFQNFFSPADQVGALLEEMMERRGRSRLAILAPRTTYGQGFARLFDAGVVARGGQVANTLWYEPTHTDFADYIRELTRMPPGQHRPGAGGKPQPDFQALFVPDSPERVALVAPQLAYQGVSGVVLLGTNLWHSPKALEMAGRSLEGAVIPDAFDPKSPSPQVISFVAEFRAATGREPSVLDAHGYDAGLLLRRALESPENPRSRRALREVLAGLRGVGGVCGEMSVDPERRIYKPLTLFTVEGGAFRTLTELDRGMGAPEAGGDPLVGPLGPEPAAPYQPATR